MQREFWRMLNFMVMRASPSFWTEIEALANADEEAVRQKAHWLLLGRDKYPVRSWVILEVYRARCAEVMPKLVFKRSSYRLLEWPPPVPVASECAGLEKSFNQSPRRRSPR
jgi:hypothetical protein